MRKCKFVRLCSTGYYSHTCCIYRSHRVYMVSIIFILSAFLSFFLLSLRPFARLFSFILLIPLSSFLIPHSSFLIPHSSLLSPPSSLLPPPSLLPPSLPFLFLSPPSLSLSLPFFSTPLLPFPSSFLSPCDYMSAEAIDDMHMPNGCLIP